MTGETPYIVGHRYFMVIGEWLSVTARVVWVGEAELVCDEVQSIGSDARWSATTLARRYDIRPCSEQIVVRRAAVDLAIEVARCPSHRERCASRPGAGSAGCSCMTAIARFDTTTSERCRARKQPRICETRQRSAA